ncbi:protein Diedel-like [Drosophila novamexicana]|uniref:protein Diedel-like n=1 Tax=Drosophila novamexicana TaxID=47314 RepID=UPI0011E602CC|nr:protein Diedel-like [Drosophila novamexicana]
MSKVWMLVLPLELLFIVSEAADANWYRKDCCPSKELTFMPKTDYACENIPGAFAKDDVCAYQPCGKKRCCGNGWCNMYCCNCMGGCEDQTNINYFLRHFQKCCIKDVIAVRDYKPQRNL